MATIVFRVRIAIYLTTFRTNSFFREEAYSGEGGALPRILPFGRTLLSCPLRAPPPTKAVFCPPTDRSSLYMPTGVNRLKHFTRVICLTPKPSHIRITLPRHDRTINTPPTTPNHTQTFVSDKLTFHAGAADPGRWSQRDRHPATTNELVTRKRQLQGDRQCKRLFSKAK